MTENIKNRLQIISDETEVQKIRKFLRSKKTNQEIDLGNIQQMPHLVEITKFPVESNFKETIIPKNSNSKEQQQIISKMNEINEKTAARLLYIKHAFGSSNSQDWAQKNWGSKSNAFDTNTNKDTLNLLNFHTNGASPIIAIKKLSTKFPSAIFVLTFADLISKVDQGRIKLQNGEILEYKGNGKFANLKSLNH
ncbi:MAG: hypothetical protein ACOYO1_00820 [Bacteroidales bacterium]